MINARPIVPLSLALMLVIASCGGEEDTRAAEDTSQQDTSPEDGSTTDSQAGEDTRSPQPDTSRLDTSRLDTSQPDTSSMDTADPDASEDTSSGDALGALDDDFSSAEVDGAWLVFNAAMFTYGIDAGELFMEPLESACNVAPHCVWFNNDNGPMLYKMVTGDFRISARVKARSAASPDEPPPPQFHFAGLIARDPASDDTGLENYIFTVMGDRGGYLTNEVKSTVDGDSTVVGPNEGITTADADLRLCRLGQTFRLYNRPHGATGPWTLEYTWDRASQPLAETLQVGLITYNYSSTVDVLGRFDEVVFRTITTESDCLAMP